MNGDTHNFYAVIMGAIVITLISAYNESFGKATWIGLLTNVIAMIIYGSVRLIDNYETKKKKASKDKIVQVKSSEIVEDAVTNGKKLAIGILYLNMIVVCFLARFEIALWNGLNVFLAFMSMLMVICGAALADYDTLLFTINVHRNPLTHSWVIPLSLWSLGMLAVPMEWRALNLLSGFFCLGYASHLLLDCIPSTAGFWEGIKECFNFKHAPGDIRGVPENWEHIWLFCAGVSLLVAFATTLARFYGALGFDYSVEDWNTESIIFAIIGIGGIAIWVALMIVGRFMNKKHPQPRTKQGYSKRYYTTKEAACDTPKIENKPETKIVEETKENDTEKTEEEPKKKSSRKKKSTIVVDKNSGGDGFH